MFVDMLAVVECVVVSAPPSMEGSTAVSRYDGFYIRSCTAYSLTFDHCCVHLSASLLTTNVLMVMKDITPVGQLTRPSDTFHRLELYADLGGIPVSQPHEDLEDDYHRPGSVK